jgi:alkylated DNA repair dioxygenase AlkB
LYWILRMYWDDRILGISLLSKCEMLLRNFEKTFEHSQILTPGSLYVLQGKSRYVSFHFPFPFSFSSFPLFFSSFFPSFFCFVILYLIV